MSILLLLLVFFQAEGSILSRRLTVPETKIIGGVEAPDGDIPYQVSLRNIISHFCGGSILNERWVITAAHCTIEFPIDVIVAVVGTNSLITGGDKYYVEKKIIHEDYDPNIITNDISIIRLKTDIKFSDRIQPISLPKRETKAGANVLLSGWGRETSKTDPLPANLQVINQTVLSLSTCQDMFADINVVTENQICTITISGAGSCQGDSGGPLVENNSLVGLVSWGVECNLRYPDVNTYVFPFVPWVEKHMASNETRSD